MSLYFGHNANKAILVQTCTLSIEPINYVMTLSVLQSHSSYCKRCLVPTGNNLLSIHRLHKRKQYGILYYFSHIIRILQTCLLLFSHEQNNLSMRHITSRLYEHLYSPNQATRQTEYRLYTQGKKVHVTIKSQKCTLT